MTVFSVASTDPVLTLEGGFDAAYGPDGSELYLAKGDRVDVIDATTGALRRSLDIASEGVRVLPDGRRLLTGRGSDAFIYAADTGEQLLSLTGHTNAVNGTAVSRDGRYVATSSWDETARVWDAETGDVVQTMVGHSELLFGLAFSPDGRSLLTGSLDNTARLWDVESGRELRRFTGHTAAVYAVDFTPDGRYAITGSADRSARVWDLARPLEADTLVGQTSFAYAVAFSPDGQQIFTGNDDGTGVLWDVATRKQRKVLFSDSRVDSAAFSPDGRSLLVAHEGRPAELWDVANGQLLSVLEGSTGGLTADFSADGRLMLAAAELPGADPPSPEGPPPSSIGLWSVASGRLERTFEVAGFGGAAISPDGRYVAAGLEEVEDNLLMFDAGTGALLRTVRNGIGVSAVRFAPDSRHVITGSRDNIARIVDVETGEMRELTGHTNIIWGADFSPDGRWALTGSQDRTARLWDVATGAEVRRFASHDYSAIAGVAFSPDGRTVGIGNFDGYTQLTPTDLDALVDSTCERLLRDFDPVERVIYEIPDERPTCATSGP